jgi:hypothetical protein
MTRIESDAEIYRYETDPKKFYRVEVSDLNGISANLKEACSKINGTWKDIEHLNTLFWEAHFKLSKIEMNDEAAKDNFFKSFSQLEMLGRNFYIYLNIIRKLIVEEIKGCDDKIDKFLQEREDYSNKIKKVRNKILIHKEGEDYLKPRGKGVTTHKKYILEIAISVEKNKEKQSYVLHPSNDVYKMHKILQKLEKRIREGGAPHHP